MDPRLEPNKIIHGDSREVLKTLPDASVDSVVTDPPAGIAFMAKEWDDPNAWKAPISRHGYSDGGDRVPAPLIGASARNPNCRKCKRHKRGWKDVPGCECEEPDFDTQDDRRADRDAFVEFLREIMAECFRVLKPGGHALVWAIPRTSHWTALALEEAGFEIRDCVYHVFGQGFPKSLNVAKAIDRMKGATREVIGVTKGKGGENANKLMRPNGNDADDAKGCGAFSVGAKQIDIDIPVTKAATPEAAQWEGWGTSLKPAVECWWLCRKPIQQANVAAQVLKTGTGAINIDGTRISGTPQVPGSVRAYRRFDDKGDEPELAPPPPPNPAGRWPSNLVLSHSPGCKQVGMRTVPAPVINRFDDGMKPFGEGAGHPYTQSGGGTEEIPIYECEPGCPIAEMDRQGEEMGIHKAGSTLPAQERWDMSEMTPSYSGGFSGPSGMRYGDDGGASRFFQNFEPWPFFYTSKASRSDKNEGLDDMPAQAQHKIEEQTISTQSNRRCRKCNRVKFGDPHCECEEPDWIETVGSKSPNNHPTVKSTKLMRYLVKMVTPKGAIVLDPFAGSGSTLVAAVQEGMQFIGIEREDEYVKIAERRVGVAADRAATAKAEKDIFDLMMNLGDD